MPAACYARRRSRRREVDLQPSKCKLYRCATFVIIVITTTTTTVIITIIIITIIITTT